MYISNGVLVVQKWPRQRNWTTRNRIKVILNAWNIELTSFYGAYKYRIDSIICGSSGGKNISNDILCTISFFINVLKNLLFSDL